MATIKDVAIASGTSTSTVSKVFNRYSEIPDETRKRVLAAAEQLDYIPRKNAVELSSKNPPKYIGLIMNNISYKYANDEYKFKLLCGINKRVEILGFELLLFSEYNITQFNSSYLNFCKYHNLYGAIFHGFQGDEEHLISLKNSEFPAIFIDRFLDNPDFVTVTIDTYNACSEVFSLLTKNNHSHICQILGSEEAEVSLLRKEAFKQAAINNNFNLENLYYIKGEFNEHLTYERTKELLKNNNKITAIFANSDLMALGAFKAITELGYTIGQNFTLIGFDGLSTLSYTTPTIATVNQNFELMGELAVDTLLRVSTKKNTKSTYFNKYNIVQRQSIHTVL